MRSSRKRRRESSTSVVRPALFEEDESHSQKRTLESEVWDTFREEYVEAVEQLPLSIHRNFALLKELDAQANVSNAALLPKVREYIRQRQLLSQAQAGNVGTHSVLHGRCRQNPGRPFTNISNSTNRTITRTRSFVQEPSQHQGLLSKISAHMNELLHTAEEKVNLAQATYDSIDRHVRLLDQAIREHELHLRDDLTITKINSPSFPISGLVMTRLKDSVESPLLPTQHDPQNRPWRTSRTRARGRTRKVLKIQSSPPAVSELLDDGVRSDARYAERVKASDMPIDPNEPRYCYCGQVSFGEMIGCDAAGCEREWFHLNCVGLTEAPKRGKWYCGACKGNRSLSRLRKRGH